MTTRVRILPSGREFISEGQSNLLEAGLRAGLRLGYGCSNGNCGQCLAKLVQGETRKVKHHDYRISEAQKASGHLLMCCNAAMGDVTLEAPEASDASEVPRQQITARVRSVRVVNDNVALVHLKTPRTNRLRFLAGQHVQLGGNGLPSINCSIGSCPCDDMNLHFQIPGDTTCEFSNHVFNELKSGDRIEINGPQGDFILDENSPLPLVFIAWRTGFASIRSLVEHAMALEVAETMHLAWVARDKEDRFLDNLCRSWADALDDFYYLPVDVNSGERAFDSHGLIFQHLDIPAGNLAGYDFYIAGNEPLLLDCKKVLTGLGVTTARIKMDQILHS